MAESSHLLCGMIGAILVVLWFLAEYRLGHAASKWEEERGRLLDRVQAYAPGVLNELSAREWHNKGIAAQEKHESQKEEIKDIIREIEDSGDLVQRPEMRDLRDRVAAGDAEFL